MKAQKSQFLFYGGAALLFNALFFLCVGVFSPNRWICYAAWHTLLLVVALTGNVYSNKGAVVHSYPLLFVNVIGFGVGTLLAIVLIVTNPQTIKLSLILFLLILIVELIVFAVIGGEKTLSDQNDAAIGEQRKFRLECMHRVEVARLRAKDDGVCSSINNLLRVIVNTQIESAVESRDVEKQILNGILELESIVEADAVLAQKKCDHLIQLVQIRDSILSRHY